MATVLEAPQTVTDYVTKLSQSDPATALQIALAETERQRAIASQQQEELRSRADVELDEHGNFKPRNLAGLWRLGVMYSKSLLVPDHYKNKTDDCAIAVQMALRCKVDILTFLQSSYIVHGRPGIEAKLVIAMVNGSGQIKGRIRWKFTGEGKTRQCTAMATDALTNDVIAQTVTWAMVEAEGWNKAKGTQTSKWVTLTDLMFQYRSAMFLARTNFPDVLMGMRTVDEIDDIVAAKEEAPLSPKTVDDLTSYIKDSLPTAEPEHVTKQPTDHEATDRPDQAAVAPDREAVTRPNTGDAPRPDPLDGIADRLDACASVPDVNALEKIVAGSCNEEELATLANLSQTRREAIRAEPPATKAKKDGTLLDKGSPRAE